MNRDDLNGLLVLCICLSPVGLYAVWRMPKDLPKIWLWVLEAPDVLIPIWRIAWPHFRFWLRWSFWMMLWVFITIAFGDVASWASAVMIVIISNWRFIHGIVKRHIEREARKDRILRNLDERLNG